MPPRTKFNIALKQKLEQKLSAKAPATVLPEYVDVAVDKIIKKGTINRGMLEKFGVEIAGNKQIFSHIDIADINDILDILRGTKGRGR